MRICGVAVLKFFLIRVSSVGKSHCQNFVVDAGLRIRGFQVIFLVDSLAYCCQFF